MLETTYFKEQFMSQRQLEDAMRILAKLDNRNSFTEEVQAPGAVGVALSTGRIELLKLYNPTAPISADEAKKLVNIIRVLIETNQALQEHAKLMVELVDNIRQSISGLGNHTQFLRHFANFQTPVEESDEE
jgi:hypothetical protein